MEEFLRGVGPYYLYHPKIVNLNESVLKVFKPKHSVAFFTTCSWAKPYSSSYIHQRIRSGLFESGLLDKMDYIHISSAGIVPSEMELWATFYDWSNDWIQDKVTFELLQNAIAERLSAFLNHFSYEKMFFYVRPNSNTAKGIKKVLSDAFFVFPSQSTEEMERDVRLLRRSLLRSDPDDVLATETAIKYMCDTILKE